VRLLLSTRGEVELLWVQTSNANKCLNSVAERRKPQLACCTVFGLLHVAENLAIAAESLSIVGLYVAYVSTGKMVDHQRFLVAVQIFELQNV